MPSTVLLDALKGVKLGLDEETARRLMNATEEIDYERFIDALAYDSQLRRWTQPTYSTPLSTLSRNLQLSASNTCVQPPAPASPKTQEPLSPTAAVKTL